MRLPHLSASLPSGFRYSGGAAHGPVARSRSFYARSRDQSEPLAPSVRSAAPKTRLEVLQGWEVSFAVVCLYAAAALALVYVLFKLDVFRAAWHASAVVPPLAPLEDLFRRALQIASVLLPVVFVLILALDASPTDEQIWTCVLLAVGLLATNPLTRESVSVPTVAPAVLPEPLRVWLRLPDTHTAPVHAKLIWNEAVYTAVIYLYLLLAAHSYRVFEVRKIHTLAFYAPKFAVAILYFIVKVLAGFKADVSLGLVPYARVLTWFYLVESGRASLRVTVPVLLTTVMDTAFAFWLVSEVAATADFLATKPYVEHRSKQLGFRCFVYQTLAFCFNMIGLSMLITYLLPRSFIYAAYDDPHEHFFQLEPPVARLALAFVYFTWTLVLAYVNLPPQSAMPFLQGLINRCLFLFRSSRVGVWLGLADIVSTEDAEDSSEDEDEETELRTFDSQHSLGAFLNQPMWQSKPTIPFRYCHRELFDDVVLSPSRVEPISPLALNTTTSAERVFSYADFCSEYNPLQTVQELDNFDISNAQPWKESPASSPILAPTPMRIPAPSTSQWASYDNPICIAPVPRTSFAEYSRSPEISRDSLSRVRRIVSPQLTAVDHAQVDRRLRLRKNLFVMETQVLMANAAYLSYIPGNPKEEVVRPCPRTPTLSRTQTPVLHTGSLSNDLADLARQIEEENITLYGKRVRPPTLQEVRPPPDHDDGTMFLVDPYAMAQRYGYRIHRHFTDETLNTHAVVLINSSRVIVAFSGTRDVTNWSVNAKINRVVLDEKLSRLEYEIESTPDADGPGAHGDDDDEDDHWHAIEAQLQTPKFDGGSAGDRRQHTPLRRSRSEERLSSVGSFCGSSSATPMKQNASGQPSYGAVAGSEKSSGSSVPRSSGEGGPSETFGFVTHEGVTRMANTFAHELLTFGKPKVHEGFLNAYMTLRKKVMGALIELYKGRSGGDVEDGLSESGEVAVGVANSLPLFFSGHSLGGALATFASYEAARYFKRIGLRRRQDISCTTFGCPRLGNDAFKARYERLVETHWRFEIASDPIPKVPITLLNYVHVGVQVLMDQSGMLLIDPSFIEVKWWGLLSNLYLGYRLHVRASYCMALRTHCKIYKNASDDLCDCFWPFPIRIQTKGLFHNSDDR